MFRTGLIIAAALAAAAGTARADATSDAAAEMEKAQDNLDRGEYDAAIGRFNVARSLVPQSSGPYLGLGLAYQRSGRCQEAVPFLEEYLRRKVNPKPEAGAALADCRAKTARAPGRVQITSEPPGAEVRVDDPAGPVVGNTPYDSSSLPPGVHRIYVSKRGFRPSLGELKVEPGLTASLAIALTPEPPPVPVHAPPPPPSPSPSGEPPRPTPQVLTGKLLVEVQPEASLSINGVQVTGWTRRFQGPVAVGVYNLLAEHDGYRSVTTTINILPGETLRKSLTLPEIRRGGWLALAIPFTVIAAVSGAAAIITFYAADGKPAGSDEFENNKTANLALQAVCYPSIAIAGIGYLIHGLSNRGRIGDGPPLRVAAVPVPGGGVATFALRLP